MDYHQKLTVNPAMCKRDNNDDDEDLEMLRMAALRSLRAKAPAHKRPAKMQPFCQYQNKPQKSNNYVNNHRHNHNHNHNHNHKQSGNFYHAGTRNPNLIEIIPMDENASKPQSEQKFKRNRETEQKTRKSSENEHRMRKTHERVPTPVKIEENEQRSNKVQEIEQKPKESKGIQENNQNSKILRETETKPLAAEGSTVQRNSSDTKVVADTTPKEPIEKTETKSELKPEVKDADDLTIAEDLSSVEKENSLDDEDKFGDEELLKVSQTKCHEDDDDILLMADLEEEDSLERLMDEMEKEMDVDYSAPYCDKITSELQLPTKSQEPTTSSTQKSSTVKDVFDVNNSSMSATTKDHKDDVLYRRNSLSPKPRSKKSPLRRSPPISQKNPRYQMPRYKPSRASRSFSPGRNSPMHRSRTPEISTRPLSRKMSPTTQKPLRLRRSRSPHGTSRLKFRRRARSRSPTCSRVGLNSPTFTLSPARRASPRMPSPSPKLSPILNSPWSSPKSSPKRSPNPNWSPKWSSSEPKQQKIQYTPENTSPICSSDLSSSYLESPERKRKEPSSKKIPVVCPSVETCPKESSADVVSDPVLEARRKKFESITPIDPLTVNKKIKLTRTKKETLVEQPEKEKANIHEIISEDELPDVEVDTYEYDDLVSLSDEPLAFDDYVHMTMEAPEEPEKERTVKKKKKKDKKLHKVTKLKREVPISERVVKEKFKKRKEVVVETLFEDNNDEEMDLRTALSRRRAERLSRAAPMQTARLLQSAFRGVVTEVAKNSIKPNQRLVLKDEEKAAKKETRRVTILQRSDADLKTADSQLKHLKKRI